MKTFRTAFPYVTDTTLPEELESLLDARGFDGLAEMSREGQGWSQVVQDARFLAVDGKVLLRFMHSRRKPDAGAVKQLTEERIAQAVEAGREVNLDLQLQIQIQAETELMKYAPLTHNVVYLLIWPAQRLLIASGSTAKKCEDALGYLRKTLGSLAVTPWGETFTLTTAVTESMTAEQRHYVLPDNLLISAFGKTLFTGTDSSLKVVLDGVQNDTTEVKGMLSGMMARSVEMSLVKRPDNSQIENLANFALQMPASGNIHFKKFDYDDDVERDESSQALIAEMHLVSSYMKEILSALELFMGSEFLKTNQE